MPSCVLHIKGKYFDQLLLEKCELFKCILNGLLDIFEQGNQRCFDRVNNFLKHR